MGLLLAEIERDGLAGALKEFADATREQFNVSCDFSHNGPLFLEENGTATHLYRIAQEAVRNAVRHGRARHIHVELSARDPEIELSISDDGVGLPPAHLRSDGLGLRIMAHRAAIIGETLTVERMSDGGTLVLCRMKQGT
jgi:signal transduction histidine kinase